MLNPRLLPERAALATLWCWADGRPFVQLWRSVFELRAPDSIASVDAAIGGAEIGQGINVPISNQLLDALFDAYVEAASTTGRIAT